ncbi:hypothetical protein ZIOFF_071509 [Zingiber officinale]|uniref:Uncharacterized protein n=1 Tax=Zingiber officinale TaxID=94328 RepID=A0A8J5CUR3_ZINOF|nr:hypothetical protein ZIOFF_071509 [Zingiber officinale]
MVVLLSELQPMPGHPHRQIADSLSPRRAPDAAIVIPLRPRAGGSGVVPADWSSSVRLFHHRGSSSALMVAGDVSVCNMIRDCIG